MKPPSILSLVLQDLDLDIVSAIKQTLKTSESLKSLMKQDPLLWPAVKSILDKVQDDGEKTYQGAVLKNFSTATLDSCKKQALADIKRLEDNMRQRLEWSDVELLRALLVFIETQSWMKRATDEECEDQSLIEVRSAIKINISLSCLWTPLKLVVLVCLLYRMK